MKEASGASRSILEGYLEGNRRTRTHPGVTTTTAPRFELGFGFGQAVEQKLCLCVRSVRSASQ